MDTIKDDPDYADAPPVTALGRPGSRAVVVGSGAYVAGSALPGIPAVAATAVAVADTLTRRCGMADRNVVAVADPESPSRFLAAIDQSASQAEDVLLLYYIGHGLVSLGGEFFLATAATTDREVMLPVEALPFAVIRSVLSASRARHVVVVLDCCFSGRASGAIGTAVADAFEMTSIRSSYLLSATSATGQALAPEGSRYTAFSGALIDLFREGTPAAPRELTLDDAYRFLERALPVRGAPVPQRRSGGDSGGLVVAPNPQAPPVTRHRPDHPGRITVSRACPYPGLESFTAADARFFHGREHLVNELLRALAADGHAGPLAVVGRSGAGKSSLLQAGLLPAIRAGRLESAVPGSRHWPQVILTPGQHPVHALGRWLAAGPAPAGMILCVDQFEEVFTACADEAERHAFIQSLCAAAHRDRAPRIQVILGLRADFYDRCLDYPELAPMVETGQVPVRPMSREELRLAIEAPADAVGLRLEEDLTKRMLLDLEPAGEHGRDIGSTLPLLAFALQSTWQQSDKQVLTLSDYEATGGIRGAVTQRAEEVYEGLGPVRDAARLLLLSMVHLGDGTDDVRRRVSVGDLLAGRPLSGQQEIRQALDAYVTARLITVDDDTAEIAHEALLRAWPRLREWIDEDRNDLLGRQRLSDAARLWRQGNGPLCTGTLLDDARRWLGEEPGRARRALNEPERDFARASIRAARRRRRRRWTAGGTAAAAALLLAVGGVYVLQQRAGNEGSQAVQSSVALAQNADNLRATDPAGAMWLSLAAYRSSQTSQARTQLYKSLTTPYPVTLPGSGSGKVDSVAYSPDGKTAAAVWNTGIVRVWRVSDPLRPVLVATMKTNPGGIDRLAFSPDGGILALHELHSLELWETGDGTRTPALLSDTPVTSSRADAHSWLPVAFSPVGHLLLVSGAPDDSGVDVHLWNVADIDRPAIAPASGDNDSAADSSVGMPVISVAFRPGSDMFLAANSGGRADIWNNDDGSFDDSNSGSFPDAAGPESVAFSPSGQQVLTGDFGGSVKLWSALVPLLPDSVGTDGVGSAFNSDGSVMVAAGHTSSATSPGPTGLFDVSNPLHPEKEAVLPGSWGEAAFLPGGSTLLTQAANTTALRLWDATDPRHPRAAAELPGPTSDSMLSLLSASKNGLLLVEDRDDVRLWNVRDPSRPVLDATLATGPNDSVTFLSDQLVGVNTRPKATESAMQLWDVSDPRHPVRGGMVNNSGGDSNGIYIPSRQVLTAKAANSDVPNPLYGLCEISVSPAS